jgi:hypothetical protein
MKRTFVTLCALSFILVGCSNDSEPSADTTTTEAVRTASNPLTPQPLGDTLTIAGPGPQALEADVTVFAVNQNVAPDARTPPSGGHWVGADIQTCLKKSSPDYAFKVSWSDWSVSDANNGQYRASGETYSEIPTPQYPVSSEPVAVGEAFEDGCCSQ